jgi:hypothetical protein
MPLTQYRIVQPSQPIAQFSTPSFWFCHVHSVPLLPRKVSLITEQTHLLASQRLFVRLDVCIESDLLNELVLKFKLKMVLQGIEVNTYLDKFI